MSDTRLSGTLLTGFLGAGKTTLLDAVLAENAAARIAIIVNEFGEAGLDSDLIEDVVLMQSGCLCDPGRSVTDHRRLAGSTEHGRHRF